jgi:hypothetical protein
LFELVEEKKDHGKKESCFDDQTNGADHRG